MREAASAAGPALNPATSTCTSGSHCKAAVTVLKVAPRMLAWSCSAITRAAMSDHLCVVLELGDEGRHVRHLDARTALGRLADLQGLKVRLNVHAEIFGL